jgi:sec-independent protein translocase protein TatC
MLYHTWAFLSPALPVDVRRRVTLWLSLALVLFFGGITFSYFLAIPAALKFLIGFSSRVAVAKITLGKYISFFGALILIGGIVFEIPIVIGLLTDAGLLKTRTLRRKRHYAILAIMIFAAVITPTQDILNMLLFALPMMLLYEAGIFIALLIERRKGSH